MKQPYAKVPRFIELPAHEKDHYLMFTEDIIKANLNLIFPGYDVDSSYCIKISRDADILIDDTASSADLVAQLKKKSKETQDRRRLPLRLRPRHAARLPRFSGGRLPHPA